MLTADTGKIRKLDVWLIASKRFLPWCQQTGSGRLERSPICATAEMTGPTSVSYNPSTNYVRHIGKRFGISLPLCCRLGRIWSKVTEQPRTVRIRRVTHSACLTGHTLESGEVDTVIFDYLPMWRLIAEGAVSERSPIRATWFFDEFRLSDIWLIDSKRFSP